MPRLDFALEASGEIFNLKEESMRNYRPLIGGFTAAGFITIVVLSIAGSGAICAIEAEDAFYDVPLSDLKITAGELPHPSVDEAVVYPDPSLEVMTPRVVLQDEGKAYVHLPNDQLWQMLSGTTDLGTAHILIRAPAGHDVAGLLTLPKQMAAGTSGLVKFSVPASQAKTGAWKEFYLAEFDYYWRLLREPTVSGKAWFRHQCDEAKAELNKLGEKEGRTTPLLNVVDESGRAASAYDLFSGGQAISENLQINRAMRPTTPAGQAQPSVDIDSLKGITIAKIDWTALLKGADPKLDPLAKLIPADQHVLFFPSFADVIRLSDEAKQSGSLLLKLAALGNNSADTMERYQQQLGLPLSELGRMVGKAAIKNVAVTGSDPYFPTGTDFAVILETDHPDVLSGLLSAQIALSAAKNPGATPQSGEVGGLKYQGFRTPDRMLCSYVAQLDGAVVIANSKQQLERLAAVKKPSDSIASLDEYKFFRTRYPIGDKNETAFLFLSDDTIRRWCSARWRIASARRTFTAAALAELTAENTKRLMSGVSGSEPLHTDLAMVDAGDLTLNADGVASNREGNLAFMTPIVEMPIEKVTKEEADAYELWRNGYEQNWQWAFDPIGLRIGVSDQKLSSDLTVMPLILGTEYRQFIAVSQGAEIKPNAGDRHRDLAHLIVSINTKSEPMREWGNTASMFAPQIHMEPFSWLGSSVALYVDDSPVWDKLREMSQKKQREEFEHSLSELPIGLDVAVTSPLKLTAFLTAVRAFIEQTAPGMTMWESLTYREQPYVRVKGTDRARQSMGKEAADIALFYAPMGDRLIVSLNEDVLKHALDRQLERDAAAKKSGGKDNDEHAAEADKDLPWLGSNLCLQIDRKMFEKLGQPGIDFLFGADGSSETVMQIRSWANIPILNEWKRLFPNEDPEKIHERLWHTTLVCPGGGQYVWNDEWKTMESTVYGHPGQPKKGPTITAALGQFQSANFGLTFEEEGLRGRLELSRKAETSK